MARCVAVGLIILAFAFSSPARADEQSKTFFTSVLYGTVAGTLVGVATLAFTSSPGDNLMNIARGASLGLYAGILLGLYLAYGTGDDSPPSGTEAPSSDSSTSGGQGQFLFHVKQDPLLGFSVFPLASQNDIGVGANLVTLRF